MFIKNYIKIFILAVMCAANAWAAPVSEPVKWTCTANADGEHGTVTLTAAIAPGFHIYGPNEVAGGPRPTTVTFTAPEGLTWTGDMQFSPQPATVIDETFALSLTQWEGTVTFSRPYSLDPGADNVTVPVTVEYMACEGNACRPPKTQQFEIQITNTAQGAVAGTQVERTLPAKSAATAVPAADNSASNQADIDIYAPVTQPQSLGLSSSSTWWSLLLMGFLGGLLALLTPCVWPMIPMTLSFFLKKTRSRARAVTDALVYGLSIIVIYLVLGLAITLIFGAGELNDIATSAVFNIIFFVILVVFAISFFGAFDIKLPSKWSNKIDSKAETTTGYLSIFFMAFTLVLVSFSCTGPIIGTLLVEAASDGSITGPALGMGGFALGLAIPFTLFAFFPSLLKEMPKSGGWMNSVKVVLGFIELILSLKFLSVADLAYGWHILDREVFVAIWIVLFILLGIYLLGKLRFSHDSDKGRTSVGGFFLAVCSLSFAVYLLPGLWGAPLKAISAFAPPLSTQDFNLYGGEIREFDDYEEGMAYAREYNLPVMLDFSGYGCVNCRKMEAAVFDTQAVSDILDNDYVMIKLMVDDKTPLADPYTVEENGKTVLIETFGEKWSYLQRHKFAINSQPYYALVDGNGQLLAPTRAYDENVDAFVEWLNTGLKAFEKSK